MELLFILPDTVFFDAPCIDPGGAVLFPGETVHQLQDLFAVIFDRDDQVINTKNDPEKSDELRPGNFA
jgi:hypothetical protein